MREVVPAGSFQLWANQNAASVSFVHCCELVGVLSLESPIVAENKGTREIARTFRPPPPSTTTDGHKATWPASKLNCFHDLRRPSLLATGTGTIKPAHGV